MTKLLWVALGGAVGTVFRYAVSGWGYRLLGETFPWGTLAVNLIGCFAVGFLWAISERLVLPVSFSQLVLTGVLGAFTTFSTYGLESFNLLRDGEIRLGLTNLVVSNLAGLLLVFLGFACARYLLSLVKLGDLL